MEANHCRAFLVLVLGWMVFNQVVLREDVHFRSYSPSLASHVLAPTSADEDHFNFYRHFENKFPMRFAICFDKVVRTCPKNEHKSKEKSS